MQDSKPSRSMTRGEKADVMRRAVNATLASESATEQQRAEGNRILANLDALAKFDEQSKQKPMSKP